ncbi:NAD-dependent epimerase/dehydratase family protein [Mesorhizobium sangaii]|uniref:Uronate dehydrogenase n=1 Tax=Mesorhizobium sangaii TaxID=505389 RepID=A0A841P7B1_9HYPH|nr:NAD(P)-dependent oxidoreductase [Mesorhizobium sangaii]MBB6408728.1 uronate dehydrogenase [Mesorhizobium sangaii]
MALSDKPVLLTGASGTIGRLLSVKLAELGWTLRLTDVVPLAIPLPQNASFDRVDLEDQQAVNRLAEGCGLILHFGGISTEQSFETVLGPNLRGSFHIYEAARSQKARVVFPSSVHAVGLYERTEILDQDCLLRPDGYYGLSKAYGEMLARLYWDKHAIESVLIRIGSVLPEVPDERILSTWISHNDFVRLIERCAEAQHVGCSVIWGQSNNSRGFWRHDARQKIGWTPLDSSDGQAERVRGKVTDNPVVERYQGGKFIVVDYSRADFPPRSMFPDE